jgi:hypothetical protein
MTLVYTFGNRIESLLTNKSMKKLKYLITAFIITIVFSIVTFSCKKGSSESPEPPKVEEEEPVVKDPPNIYVVGSETTPLGVVDGVSLVYSTIKCWKNGTSVNLGGYLGRGNAIAISGDDIYIAATLNEPGISFGSYTSKAGYFKNSSAVSVAEPTSRANGIAISNNDVYICGYDRHKGVVAYWKNGTIVKLSSATVTAGTALGIFVKGSDVYVAGYETTGTYPTAKYWKNQTAVSLTNGMNDASASSITVVGTDVYVAGYEKVGLTLITKYWKNGTSVNLGDGNNDSFANSIVVVGNDVYVAGGERTGSTETAKYWKNSTPVNLGSGRATAIAIDGSDVYVAGVDGAKAKYWKNGTSVNLPLGNGTISGVANGIAIVPTNK